VVGISKRSVPQPCLGGLYKKGQGVVGQNVEGDKGGPRLLEQGTRVGGFITEEGTGKNVSAGGSVLNLWGGVSQDIR